MWHMVNHPITESSRNKTWAVCWRQRNVQLLTQISWQKNKRWKHTNASFKTAVKLHSGSCCRVGTVLFLLYCHFKPHWPLHWPHASLCRTVTINLLLLFFLPSCFVLLLLPDSAPVCSALMTMSVLTSSSSSSSSCCAFILFWTSRLPFLSSLSFFSSHFFRFSIF